MAHYERSTDRATGPSTASTPRGRRHLFASPHPFTPQPADPPHGLPSPLQVGNDPNSSFLGINQECSRDRAVCGLLAPGAASMHLSTEQLPTEGGGGKMEEDKQPFSLYTSIRRWGSDLRHLAMPLIEMN